MSLIPAQFHLGACLHIGYQRVVAADPVRQPGRFGDNLAQLFETVQPPHPPARHRFQNADSDTEGMAGKEAGAIR